MNQTKLRMNSHDKQEELRAFLVLHKIDYTENRIQFYQDIENIFASNVNTIYAAWNCKLREWANILSISDYRDSEQYFSDLIRRITYTLKTQSNIKICRSASDEIILFCSLGDCTDVETTITDISERLLEDAKYSYKIGTSYIQNRLSIGICHGNKSKFVDAVSLISEAKIMMDQLTFSRYGSAYLIAPDENELKKRKTQEKNKEIKIESALKNKLFVPFFQPICSTFTGKMIGFECLARLEEDSTVLPPGYFLPLIKSLQLTADLDIIICEKVIASIGIIHAKSPYTELTFNINVSGDLIRSAEKRKKLLDLLTSAQLPSNKKLQVEIVEDSFEVDSHVMDDFFTCLELLNVKVYIDDFGLGFSSIDRILSLPIQGVKLDSIFVAGLGERDMKKNNFLGSIVKALSNSGLEIVAESIENTAQLDWIKTLNVAKYQGYISSKPISLQDTLLFIATNEIKPKAISPKNRRKSIDSLSFRRFVKENLRKYFLNRRRS